MKKGDRVKHAKYGAGTIIHTMFDYTKHEIFLVKFDVSNSELHNGLAYSSENDCLFCSDNELEVIN